MKPDRAPDLIIKPGHAVWWAEMIFMHVYGVVYRIEINQEDGSLCYSHFDISNGGHKLSPLPKGAKEQYDAWWYETFEKKFLGNENE